MRLDERLELWPVVRSPREDPGEPRIVATAGRVEIHHRDGTVRAFAVPNDISAATVDNTSTLYLLGSSGQPVLTLDPGVWVPELQRHRDHGWEDVPGGSGGGPRLPRRFTRLLDQLDIALRPVPVTRRGARQGQRVLRDRSRRWFGYPSVWWTYGPLALALLSFLIPGGPEAVTWPLRFGLAALACGWVIAHVAGQRWNLRFPTRHQAGGMTGVQLRPVPRARVDAAFANRSMVTAAAGWISVVDRGWEVRYPRHGGFGVQRLEVRTVGNQPVQVGLTEADGTSVHTLVWDWWFPDPDLARVGDFASRAGLELAEVPAGELTEPVPDPAQLWAGSWWVVPVQLMFWPLTASVLVGWWAGQGAYRYAEAILGLAAAAGFACLVGGAIIAVRMRRAARLVAPEGVPARTAPAAPAAPCETAGGASEVVREAGTRRRVRLVGTEAEPYLHPVATDRSWASRAEALAEQARAVAVLEREYGSWTRLATGAASVLLLSIGIAGLGLSGALVVSDEVAASAAESLLIAGIGFGFAAAFTVPGWWLGHATVRAGRRVVDALVWWHRLPQTVPADGSHIPPELRRPDDAVGIAEQRAISAQETARVHGYIYRGPLTVRIAVGGLLAVPALLAWGLSLGALATGETTDHAVLAATLAALAVIVTAATAFVLGGSLRVNAAHARRRPRLRRRPAR